MSGTQFKRLYWEHIFIHLIKEGDVSISVRNAPQNVSAKGKEFEKPFKLVGIKISMFYVHV